jgi:nitrous oxide reductase accessory protein NosL
MRRRRFLLAAVASLAALTLAACKREPRCEFCGMKLDPASPWMAETLGTDGATHRFDTPKCALLAWRSGKVPATSARFQEFYDRTWQDGATLAFALGSDVIGPMGEDAVPVDPKRAAKLAADHHASRVAKLEELTQSVLESL